MSGVTVWVRSDDAFPRLLEAAAQGVIAVDLEADSFHCYREKVCLVQILADGTVFLVDPLAGADLRRLAPILADPAIRKVLHGADYDLRLLGRDHGVVVRGLFDTMIASRLVGERAFGLAALLASYLDVDLDKRHQRADWSRRPLPEELTVYAAADVLHLVRLADRLEERLDRLGRGNWAREEFVKLEAVRWKSETKTDPEAFRALKGARDLDRRGLAVLREVFTWRDREARERDVPPFKIARDEVLVAISGASPATRSDPSGARGLPDRYRRGAAAAGLVAAISRGLAAANDDLPPLAERAPRRAPDRAFEARLHRLKAKRDAIASRLDLDPSVLAPRGVLEGILRAVDAVEPIATVPGIRAWQVALLEPLMGDVRAP